MRTKLAALALTVALIPATGATALALPAAAPLQASTAASEGLFEERAYALSDAPNLPVRAEPHAAAEVIGVLQPGQIYSVRFEEYGDARVDLNGAVGWVSSSALQQLPAEDPTDADFTEYGVITGAAGRGIFSGVNDRDRWTLFQYPTTDSRRLDVLNPGQQVSLASNMAITTSGWGDHRMVPIRTDDGTIGWTYEANVQVTGSPDEWVDQEMLEYAIVYDSASDDAAPVCQLFPGEEVATGIPFDGYTPVDHGSDIGYLIEAEGQRFRDRISDGFDSLTGKDAPEAIQAETVEGEYDESLISCAELDGRESPAAAVEEEPEVEETADAPATAEPTAGPAEEEPAPSEVEAAPVEEPAEEGMDFTLIGGIAAALLLGIGAVVFLRKRKNGSAGDDESGYDVAPAPAPTPATAAPVAYEEYDYQAQQAGDPVTEEFSYEEYDYTAAAESGGGPGSGSDEGGDPLAALFNQRSDD